MFAVIAREIIEESVNIVSSYFVASGTFEPVEFAWISPTRFLHLGCWSSNAKID